LTAASSYKPGALAAHAGICAGGEEQSSSLPRPWATLAMVRRGDSGVFLLRHGHLPRLAQSLTARRKFEIDSIKLYAALMPSFHLFQPTVEAIRANLKQAATATSLRQAMRLDPYAGAHELSCVSAARSVGPTSSYSIRF